jgi:hypothetical protein
MIAASFEGDVWPPKCRRSGRCPATCSLWRRCIFSITALIAALSFWVPRLFRSLGAAGVSRSLCSDSECGRVNGNRHDWREDGTDRKRGWESEHAAVALIGNRRAAAYVQIARVGCVHSRHEWLLFERSGRLNDKVSASTNGSSWPTAVRHGRQKPTLPGRFHCRPAGDCFRS